MKTFPRSLAAAASLLGILALAPASAAAAGHGGAAFSGAGHSGGGWGHSGSSWHDGGNWHGGHGHGGGYWPYWGIGLGFGAIGYWGSYPYYGSYYPASLYYGGDYYDAPVVIDPTYGTVDPSTGTRAGGTVPHGGQAADPIYYPKNGQSAATTESDRRECNRWATTQTGTMNDAGIFQRATLACMEGRGYTVR